MDTCVCLALFVWLAVNCFVRPIREGRRERLQKCVCERENEMEEG